MELVGVCFVAEKDVERGGVGRAEVDAVGVEREVAAFAGGVRWGTAMEVTEAGMRGWEVGGDEPGGRDEGGGAPRGWY